MIIFKGTHIWRQIKVDDLSKVAISEDKKHRAKKIIDSLVEKKIKNQKLILNITSLREEKIF